MFSMSGYLQNQNLLAKNYLPRQDYVLAFSAKFQPEHEDCLQEAILQSTVLLSCPFSIAFDLLFPVAHLGDQIFWSD
jgi:hypothetical protein